MVNRSRAWTPERKARMLATRRARKKADPNYGRRKVTLAKEKARAERDTVQVKGSKPDHQVIDAITYLKHARTAMTGDLREGKIKQYDRAHLYALLALDALLGGL